MKHPTLLKITALSMIPLLCGAWNWSNDRNEIGWTEKIKITLGSKTEGGNINLSVTNNSENYVLYGNISYGKNDYKSELVINNNFPISSSSLLLKPGTSINASYKYDEEPTNYHRYYAKEIVSENEIKCITVGGYEFSQTNENATIVLKDTLDVIQSSSNKNQVYIIHAVYDYVDYYIFPNGGEASANDYNFHFQASSTLETSKLEVKEAYYFTQSNSSSDNRDFYVDDKEQQEGLTFGIFMIGITGLLMVGSIVGLAIYVSKRKKD